MTYAIPQTADTAKGIRHCVEDQIAKGLEELDDHEEDLHERVHNVRKRFKKIRAALRLARKPLGDRYKPDNVLFRDAGRRLSEVRDAQAMIETLHRLRDVYSSVLNDYAFSDLHRELELRRDTIAESLDLPNVLKEMRPVFEEGRDRMNRWSWKDGSFDDLRAGLGKSFKRARRARDEAYETGEVEAFHEWRKRSKYHRYHLRILRYGWAEVLNAEREELHTLTDYLGDDHDLAVFIDTLEAEFDTLRGGTDLKALRGLIEAESADLRKKAKPLGALFFDEPTDVMCDRIERIWRARSVV
jgi:CHAD domain-containing protein